MTVREAIERTCRHCCAVFFADMKTGRNKQYCSDLCSENGRRASIKRFHERNPDREAVYRARSRKKAKFDTALLRLKKRFPGLVPDACQSCGDDRVLEIAHKPEHKRNGSQRSSKNTTLAKVWILCPTCHELLDRKCYTPAELGLVRSHKKLTIALPPRATHLSMESLSRVGRPRRSQLAKLMSELERGNPDRIKKAMLAAKRYLIDSGELDDDGRFTRTLTQGERIARILAAARAVT